VHWSLDAAKAVEKDGIDVEVVDLRSLIPFDKEMILSSVKKTGKALIVHEDTLTGGIGAEISAFLSENAFRYLDAPIGRVAALDTPVPYAPTLEEFFLPNAKKVEDAVRKLASY